MEMQDSQSTYNPFGNTNPVIDEVQQRNSNRGSSEEQNVMDPYFGNDFMCATAELVR